MSATDQIKEAIEVKDSDLVFDIYLETFYTKVRTKQVEMGIFAIK